MDELDERVARLEVASENTAARVLALEHDVAALRRDGATKADVVEARAVLAAAIAEAKAQLLAEIAEAKITFRAEIGVVENRLRTEIAEVKNALRTEIEKTRASLIRWVVSSVLLAVLLPVLVKQLGF